MAGEKGQRRGEKKRCCSASGGREERGGGEGGGGSAAGKAGRAKARTGKPRARKRDAARDAQSGQGGRDTRLVTPR